MLKGITVEGDIGLNRSKRLIFAAEQINSGPPGELVGDLARTLVNIMSCRSEWLYAISVHSLEGCRNVSGFDLEISQLTTFPDSTNVAVGNGAVKGDAVAVTLLHILQSLLLR